MTTEFLTILLWYLIGNLEALVCGCVYAIVCRRECVCICDCWCLMRGERWGLWWRRWRCDKCRVKWLERCLFKWLLRRTGWLGVFYIEVHTSLIKGKQRFVWIRMKIGTRLIIRSNGMVNICILKWNILSNKIMLYLYTDKCVRAKIFLRFLSVLCSTKQTHLFPEFLILFIWYMLL